MKKKKGKIVCGNQVWDRDTEIRKGMDDKGIKGMEFKGKIKEALRKFLKKIFMKNKSNNFSLRKLLTLINDFSFLLMVISGIVLFFVPQGRIAYWIEWKFIFFTKNDWVNIHTASWFLFLICSSFHIYYNFKPLKNYSINKAKSFLFLRKETFLAILIFFIFVFSAILRIPPTG